MRCGACVYCVCVCVLRAALNMSFLSWAYVFRFTHTRARAPVKPFTLVAMHSHTRTTTHTTTYVVSAVLCARQQNVRWWPYAIATRRGARTRGARARAERISTGFCARVRACSAVARVCPVHGRMGRNGYLLREWALDALNSPRTRVYVCVCAVSCVVCGVDAVCVHVLDLLTSDLRACVLILTCMFACVHVSRQPQYYLCIYHHAAFWTIYTRVWSKNIHTRTSHTLLYMRSEATAEEASHGRPRFKRAHFVRSVPNKEIHNLI